jgi:hypothetical protein
MTCASRTLRPCSRKAPNASRSHRYPVSLPTPAARAEGLTPRPSRTAARNRTPAALSLCRCISTTPSNRALRRSMESGGRSTTRRLRPLDRCLPQLKGIDAARGSRLSGVLVDQRRAAVGRSGSLSAWLRIDGRGTRSDRARQSGRDLGATARCATGLGSVATSDAAALAGTSPSRLSAATVMMRPSARADDHRTATYLPRGLRTPADHKILPRKSLRISCHEESSCLSSPESPGEATGS